MRLLSGFQRVFGESFWCFWASWGAFWASRGSLGSLLEPLGAILGRLGAKFCGLGVTFGAPEFCMIFWSDFGSKKGAQREAFWEPKRIKNLSKKRCKLKSEKVTSWSRLGEILARFPWRRGVKNKDF